jgi:hypothetical protein
MPGGYSLTHISGAITPLTVMIAVRRRDNPMPKISA